MPILELPCHANHGLITPVILAHPDPERATRLCRQVTAVIDTGAQPTSIREHIAVDLELPLIRRVGLDAVNNTSECPVYRAWLQIPFTDTDKTYHLKSLDILGVNPPPYLIV